MAENTYISDVLEGNDCKDRLDTEVKKVLSDKTVLAWILKYTVARTVKYFTFTETDVEKRNAYIYRI